MQAYTHCFVWTATEITLACLKQPFDNCSADWADGVVGKVYMYITGCVSARRVYSARVCVYICISYGKWWA